MGNIFNEDFRDFITSLNNQQVEYILVGGYSVILHGYSRTTGDLDVDIMTEVKGLQFEKAFQESEIVEVENLQIRLIHYSDLIKAKKSSGRAKDIDDLENLKDIH